MTYRPGNYWGVTIVREGGEPADGAGRRGDDELVAVVVNGDQNIAAVVGELLTAAETACDCGHAGLALMFHLRPCPVAALRDAARTQDARARAESAADARTASAAHPGNPTPTGAPTEDLSDG